MLSLSYAACICPPVLMYTACLQYVSEHNWVLSSVCHNAAQRNVQGLFDQCLLAFPVVGFKLHPY